MAALAPDVEEIQRRLRYDTPFWAGGVRRGPAGEVILPGPKDWHGAAKIVNKKAQLVPAVAKPWQIAFDDRLEAQRAAGKPMRGIVLKARKLGFSTWVALKFLQRLTQMPYQQAIVCAQDTKTAGVVFDMASTAHAHLPTYDELGLGFNIRPEVIGGNFAANGRKFMQFGEPSVALRRKGRTGSSTFEIDTAQSAEAGRGYTPQYVHLSEVARWEGQMATRKMLALLEAVPYEEETIVILESTANGLNHFYRRWQAAIAGESDPERGEAYFALFVAWHEDPDSAIPFVTEEARERFTKGIGDTKRFGDVAEDELALRERFGLTPEQLYWRRMKIAELPDQNVLYFKQENPSSAEEAFIGSGQSVFPGLLVARGIRAAEEAPEPVAGTLSGLGVVERPTRGGTRRVPSGAEWTAVETMRAHAQLLEVWEHPRAEPEVAPERVIAQQPSAMSSAAILEAAAARAEQEQREADPLGAGRYIVAADIAEGEANTFDEGDFHALTVIDHDTLCQVAVWASRCDLQDVAPWLLLVALYYNEALLSVEANGPGVAVVDQLHKEYRYRNLYRRKRIDRLNNKVEKKPGWETNKVSKPAMEITFGAALAAEDPPGGGLRDIRTARELTTYVIDEKGRHGALPGEHDDRLMAAMQARRVAETERPMLRAEPAGVREPYDDVTGW